jgi:hypothetical protein
MLEKVQERKIVVYDKSNGKLLEKIDLKLPAMRSIAGFLKGEWDLDTYSDCFGGKNRLGDIDASIEIDGHHLVVEFKEHENGMNKGQVVKAVRMARYCNTTTFFVFGKTNQPTKKIIISPKVLQGELSDTNEKELKFLFSKWFSKAKLNPMANRSEMTADWDTATQILGGIGK